MAKNLKILSRKWLQRQSKDIYKKQANDEGYISRSAYKLQEIDKKYKVLSIKNKHANKSANPHRVLEVGAAPGGWSQYILRNYKNSELYAIDMLPLQIGSLKEFSNLHFIQTDIFDCDMESLLQGKKIDVILSDIAPNTSGGKDLDHIRIINVCEDIRDRIIPECLEKGGYMVIKVFDGKYLRLYCDSLTGIFHRVERFKPRSSRKASPEIYLVGMDLR